MCLQLKVTLKLSVHISMNSYLFSLTTADARCSNFFWTGCNFDRPEYTGVPYVYECPSSGICLFLSPALSNAPCQHVGKIIYIKIKEIECVVNC